MEYNIEDTPTVDTTDKATAILKKYKEAVSIKDHWREKFE